MSLIKTTAEVRKYIQVDANLIFETLKPSIDDAEELFIKDLLGEFYSILLADYTDNTDAAGADTGMNADNLLLLPFVQRALTYYSLYLSIENLGVNIGDEGIQQSFGQNSQPAPKWKIIELKTSYITKADRFADKMLEYLEDNASGVKYVAWFTDTDANTAMSGRIVYSTKIASKHIDINESRRMFLRLKKWIADIEGSYVKRIICKDQYDALVTELKDGTLTDPNKALIDKLQPYIAKKALSDAIPSLAISITTEGLSLLSVSDSLVTQEPAGYREEKQIAKLQLSLKFGDFGYQVAEDEIKAFIIQNIADYPLIAGSPCYTATPVARKYVPDNNPCNKSFSV